MKDNRKFWLGVSRTHCAMKGEKDTRARVEKRAGGTGKRKDREWVTKTNDTQSPLCKPTTL